MQDAAAKKRTPLIGKHLLETMHPACRHAACVPPTEESPEAAPMRLRARTEVKRFTI